MLTICLSFFFDCTCFFLCSLSVDGLDQIIVVGGLASHKGVKNGMHAPVGPPVRQDLPITVHFDFDMHDYPSFDNAHCIIKLMEDGGNANGMAHYHKVTMLVGPGTSWKPNGTQLLQQYRIALSLETVLGESMRSPSHQMGAAVVVIRQPMPPALPENYVVSSNRLSGGLGEVGFPLTGAKSDYADIVVQFNQVWSTMHQWKFPQSGNGAIQNVYLVMLLKNGDQVFSVKLNGTESVPNDIVIQDMYRIQSKGIKSSTPLNLEGEGFTQFTLTVPIRKLYFLRLRTENNAPVDEDGNAQHLSMWGTTKMIESPGACDKAFTGPNCDITVICQPEQRSDLCTKKQPVTLTVTGFNKNTFNVTLYLTAQKEFLKVPMADIKHVSTTWLNDDKVRNFYISLDLAHNSVVHGVTLLNNTLTFFFLCSIL